MTAKPPATSPAALVAVFLAAVLPFLAAGTGTASAQTGVPGGTQVQPDVARRLTDAIARNGLAGMSAECLLFAPAAETPAYLDLEVRERHGGACPGDPATSPRLFMLRYDKASGIVLKQSIDPGVGYVPLR